MYDISINWDGLQKDHQVNNYLEIAQSSKFSYAHVRTSRAGL
jgi:hypothetical protein